MAGGKLGLALGLALAPATGGASAIVIPAATTFIGGLVGVFTGKGLSGWFKSRHLRKAVADLKIISVNFRNEFVNQYFNLNQIISEEYNSRISHIKLKERKKSGFLRRIFFPSTFVKLCQLLKKNVKKEYLNSKKFYKNLRYKINSSEESEGGLILFAQGKDILYNISPLISMYDDLNESMISVKIEKEKLS